MSNQIPGSAYNILVRPIYSEKSTRLNGDSKYVFEVDGSATKPQIKRSIEGIFNVKVLNVNTLNVKGTSRIFKGFRGKTQAFKKVVVSLPVGQTIQLV